MEKVGIATLILIITNIILTYKGLKERNFLNTFSFRVNEILNKKDYKRLITSGFLHINWIHFSFNIVTLYLFSYNLESYLGPIVFSLLYFTSLIGGNIFALFIHKNHPDYSAVGASGAVSGLVFAAIGLFPKIEIGFIFIPIQIPAWLYGIIFVLYSIYGIKNQKDNIGHEAHLGGGIFGLLFAILLQPSILVTNYFPIALITIPSSIFLYLIITKPSFLIVSNPFTKSKGYVTIDDKYNEDKVNKENELNKILDKINKKGYDSLSKKDKRKLDELSNKTNS